MSQQAQTTEGPLGWARLGCSTVVLALVPVWAMLTALTMAGPEFDNVSGLSLWIAAGGSSLFWVIGASGVVLAGLLVVRGFARMAEVRRNRHRRALDAMIDDESGLPEDAWHNTKEVAEPPPDGP